MKEGNYGVISQAMCETMHKRKKRYIPAALNNDGEESERDIVIHPTESERKGAS